MTGSKARTPCPAGTYARRGASFCITCDAGYICPQTGTGANLKGAVSPTKCPDGNYCPPGTGNAPDI